MQVHALRELLALHAQQRGPRGSELQLLLLDAAQIVHAHLVALARHGERALALAHGLREQRLARL